MLKRAVALADELNRILAAEVERARAEPAALRSLDAEAVFASATRRATFNGEVARIEEALAGALAACAASLGHGAVSLPRLAPHAPAQAAALGRILDEIRGHAGAVAELDAQNRSLAARALACVRGYLAALRPPTSSYDRRGGRPSAPAEPSFRSKA